MVGDESYKVLFFYYAPVRANKRGSNVNRNANRASESSRAYFNEATNTSIAGAGAGAGIATPTQTLKNEKEQAGNNLQNDANQNLTEESAGNGIGSEHNNNNDGGEESFAAFQTPSINNGIMNKSKEDSAQEVIRLVVTANLS